LTLGLGTLLAYVQVRTDAPLKGLFFAASLVPLIIPGILYAAAWIFLADPRIGLINAVLFKPILGHGLFNTFSMWGMIWVQGLHLAPIAFLLMAAAFRSMDPALEEAALMAGAPRHVLLRRITMPLVRPAIVSAILLMFVQSLESFEVPGLLGLQNGIYVFTSRIYFVLRQFPIDYGAAGAYALGLLGFAIVGVALSGWLSRNARGYQTVTGKAFRPRPMELGRARPLIGGLVVLYFAVAVVLPVAVLVYASLLKLIAYSTRYLPYGMRYASSAMSQTSGELEESAHVCGASWWQTFRRVLLPLASSGILAGWVYILVVSFRELSSSILLYSPGKEVLHPHMGAVRERPVHHARRHRRVHGGHPGAPGPGRLSARREVRGGCRASSLAAGDKGTNRC
jgi:ABC-type Fe3+ transport system permease subunit